MMIYVRCANCGELVARYELSGYYHHGKGLESYLKSRGVDASESGRQWLAQFNEVSEQAAVGYRDALEELQKAGKSLD